MAWNRSSNDGRANTPGSHGSSDFASQSSLRLADKRRGRSPRPTVVRGVVAGLVVALGAAVAAWWLWPSEETRQDAASTKKTLIKEVKPQLSVKEQEKLEHPGMVKVRGKWYPEYNEQGGKIWVTKNWVRYHTPEVYTNRISAARQRKEFKIFSNSADRDIAMMLNAKPGSIRLGNREFTKGFETAFLESLKEPIIVSTDDDEETAFIKKSVREAKIDLKARYDAGEDIVQIMNETDKQHRQLAAYRQELQELVRQETADKTKETQVKRDFVEAANKMLAERGLPPLKMPRLLKRKIELESLK